MTQQIDRDVIIAKRIADSTTSVTKTVFLAVLITITLYLVVTR